MKKIETLEQLEVYIKENFEGKESSIDEINTYPEYSLEGDNDERMPYLYKVYKMKGNKHPDVSHSVVFTMVFSKNGKTIYETKSIGVQSKKMEKMWMHVVWDES